MRKVNNIQNEKKSLDEDHKNCIKGRLTVLYRMQLEWKKLKDNLTKKDFPTLHFLKPCSIINSRFAGQLKTNY